MHLVSFREVGEMRKKCTWKPRWAMRERVPSCQMGIIVMSKDLYLEPISVVIIIRIECKTEERPETHLVGQ